MVASCPLVRPDQFIQAVRDNGYRSTASALAELVDNSIEAGATRVQIALFAVEREHSGPGRPAMPRVVEIVVADNGAGMPPEVLRSSLQFAGSTRFGQRDGLGRFGMG
ncbi:MAG: ATP-binding protein, partial [Phycisphaerales bacterium]